MDPATAARTAPLADVVRAFVDAGVRPLVLGELAGYPHVELLVGRGGARAFRRALPRTPWRWCFGADGAARIFARRRLAFDGGFLVTVHLRLPAAPLPARALRPLERALWDGAAPGPDGLLRPRDEARVAYAALQRARGGLRSQAEQADLSARAARLADPDVAQSLAEGVGAAAWLPDTLCRRGRAAPRRNTARAAAWRTARAVTRRRDVPPLLEALVAGEPWRAATARCRFDGLELLAGPGIFLPRGVSEQLVVTGAQRLAEERSRLAVDVGTGCGAIALALARRAPHARVIGLDLDPGATEWARRNARRLGIAGARFAAGPLLEPLGAAAEAGVDLICANVPCVPAPQFDGALDAPALAYVGSDDDGLGLQRRLAADARRFLRPGGTLLVQLVPDQADSYCTELRRLGFAGVEAGEDRIAVVAHARWPGAAGSAYEQADSAAPRRNAVRASTESGP